MKFIHTADWQIGAAFRQVPGDAGARIRAARLEVIERIGTVARERQADFILIAGDLFDSHMISHGVIAEACTKLGRLTVPVYVIPGNHDYGEGIESIYQGRAWATHRPENVHLLLDSTAQPVLEGRAVILPCPMVRRHIYSDPTAHLAAAIGTEIAPNAIRIGLAHGTVIGFEPEDDEASPNVIDPGVVERAELDYLALGDWHGTCQVNDRAWYSGTPEPDRFKDNNPGNVLLVEIGGPKAAPKVEPIPVAHYSWLNREARMFSLEDLTSLESSLESVVHPDRTLMRLTLQGSLNLESHTRLGKLTDRARERFFHLRLEGEGVLATPSDEEIAAMSSDAIVARVINQLRNRITANDPQAAAARVGLQMLHRWIAGQKEAGL